MNETCSIELRPDGSARLRGDLTFESVPTLFREAVPLFANGPDIECIDLADIAAADSAGLALLLEWRAQNRAADTELKIINAPASLISLARLAEATELLNLSGRPA